MQEARGDKVTKVILSGGSGLIGTELKKSLESDGVEVVCLVRRKPKSSEEVQWDPYREDAGMDSSGLAQLEDASSWVHLSGANVASGRWTKHRKQELHKSRIVSTTTAAKVIKALGFPPQSFIVASAVGIYGDRQDQWMDEGSYPGKGFLADLVIDWEKAAHSHGCTEVRTVVARLGVVISNQGGALAKMLFPFKLGLGGVLGSGKQYMSWISLRDAVQGFRFLMETSLSGPVNLVSPDPVTNREWTRTLGKVLSRPTPFPVPEWFLKTALGEMGKEVLLSGVRVRPQKLLEEGFPFFDLELRECLENTVSK